jgi:hypothetical protein
LKSSSCLCYLLFFNQPEDEFEMSASSSRPKSLSAGVRVAGPFGKLVENPRGHKRRMRQRIFDIVVCAASEHKYNVRFETNTEQVCFSTSLRVESHDIVIPLEAVMPCLPMAQQEKAQGCVEDTEEEEEENDFLDILAGVDDDALPSDCNIENNQYEDLFGHREGLVRLAVRRTTSGLTRQRRTTPPRPL